jgi:hypothetical protein
VKDVKTGSKPKIMVVIVMLLGLSLSGCPWMMVPMMATHVGQTKTKEETKWTFWKRLEAADTPQKHRGIAESYRQEAEDYRLLAEQHQQVKAVYRGYKDKPNMDEETAELMVIHCQRLVEKFTELADEMESLAQKHETIADTIAGFQKEDTE